MFFSCVYIESLSLFIRLWNIFNQVLCASKTVNMFFTNRNITEFAWCKTEKKAHTTIVKMKCRVRQMEIYGKSMRCKKQSTIAAVIGLCTCEMRELESRYTRTWKYPFANTHNRFGNSKFRHKHGKNCWRTFFAEWFFIQFHRQMQWLNICGISFYVYVVIKTFYSYCNWYT